MRQPWRTTTSCLLRGANGLRSEGVATVTAGNRDRRARTSRALLPPITRVLTNHRQHNELGQTPHVGVRSALLACYQMSQGLIWKISVDLCAFFFNRHFQTEYGPEVSRAFSRFLIESPIKAVCWYEHKIPFTTCVGHRSCRVSVGVVQNIVNT